jgi:serralysin
VTTCPAGDDVPFDEGGDDVLYGGSESDAVIGREGADVHYGGDGNDYLDTGFDGPGDLLYCGKGNDHYMADRLDYVLSGCEEGSLLSENFTGSTATSTLP